KAMQAAAGARPWVEGLARFGFAAKGVVYALIGFVALKAALGMGGKTTDAAGALRMLLHQPFGKALLGTVAVGLFGYALWRLVQALLDPGGSEPGVKGIVERVGYGVSGVTYVLLGLTAVRMLTGGGKGGGSTRDWSAQLMSQSLGPWLVGGVGAVAVAVGLYFLYRSYRADFRDEFNLGEMSATEERWATVSGRIGYAARGVVFSLIGFFAIQAAMHLNAGEVRDMGGVLNRIAHQPYGPWLLGLVAVGLMAYAFHMFVAARYRRVWA
ncbi:MAG TPA: DUF1206 domain-containing protein, partial [Armatimonadota bacterium]|nr:DUF1206 domain-containing protein [Armatimonadota bacterium]